MSGPSPTYRILVVDDDKDIVQTIKGNLELDGYEVFTALDGRTCLQMARDHRPDLIILDLNLPDIDGIKACQILRREFDFPIIMLTARDGVADKVLGLECGADDYIVKPFSATELLARVRAVLRRAQVSGSTFQQSVFNHGNLQIDLARAEVFKDEKMVFLSATEYRLLLQFVHNLGSILTSEDLLVNVWGPEYREDKEILWVSISRLRQKLEDDPRNPQHIVTRSGMGYTMPPS